jgi:glycosyltransferase involved in cell wall biosynthesis
MGKITFIATVFNEEASIVQLLESLKKQTKKADEIIIVDAGSRDGTVS